MYEYIQGTLAELTPASAVIDCGGVGYFIMITLQGYENLMGKSTAKIYVHYHVKEDGHELYGFVTKDERELFRQLISVSGIGVGTARIMLSSLSAAALREAILTENLTLLKGVKGIGLKTAQRVILELKDKVGKSDGPQMPRWRKPPTPWLCWALPNRTLPKPYAPSSPKPRRQAWKKSSKRLCRCSSREKRDLLPTKIDQQNRDICGGNTRNTRRLRQRAGRVFF